MIDLDGVVYDFVGTLTKWTAETLGRDLDTLPYPESWDFYRYQWGMRGDEFRALCDRAVDAGVLFATGDAIPGAARAIRKLRNEGHSIHFVTDRHYGTHSEANTKRWLVEQGIPYDSLTFASDKTVVDCDLYLDDRDANIEALRDAGKRAVVFDQPWNRTNGVFYCERAYGWAHFLSIVAKLEQPAAILYVDGDLDDDATEELRRQWGAGHVWRSGSVWGEPEQLRPEHLATGGLVDPSVPYFVGESDRTCEVRVVNATTGGEKGQKLARFGLLPGRALWQVAEHYGKGAEKYAPHNWRRGYAWSLSYDALQRHAWLWQSGEDCDPETGSHHMAAVAFHALALLTFAEDHPALDDRPHTEAARVS